MKDFILRIWSRLRRPSLAVFVISFLLTVASAILSFVPMIGGFHGAVWTALSYVFYVVAAVSLTYTVYLIVVYAPGVKGRVVAFLESRKFTADLMKNYGYRTVVFAIISFALSVAYAAWNGYLGIIASSIWYGALAAYYILLAFLRGGIIVFHGKRATGLASYGTEDEYRLMSLKKYRNCGILLVILNVALSAAIAQMIFDDRFFNYPEWTIFASAAYTFYKVGMSIYNIFKARRQDDLTVEAIRNINLTDAVVSILALQTGLLHAFSDGSIGISDYNTLTGIAVTACVLSIGIFMIVKATREINRINKGVE